MSCNTFQAVVTLLIIIFLITQVLISATYEKEIQDWIDENQKDRDEWPDE